MLTTTNKFNDTLCVIITETNHNNFIQVENIIKLVELFLNEEIYHLLKYFKSNDLYTS